MKVTVRGHDHVDSPKERGERGGKKKKETFHSTRSFTAYILYVNWDSLSVPKCSHRELELSLAVPASL
jgi:hypothetical protein